MFGIGWAIATLLAWPFVVYAIGYADERRRGEG